MPLAETASEYSEHPARDGRHEHEIAIRLRERIGRRLPTGRFFRLYCVFCHTWWLRRTCYTGDRPHRGDHESVALFDGNVERRETALDENRTQADVKPKLAIVGGGPIGLEAALYGRYLGYEVQVFEAGTVGDHVRRWGHVRLFTPWRMNCTSLGIAALAAQQPGRTMPDAESPPTGRELVEEYLLPLASSDLLSGCVHEHTAVVAIGRQGLLKAERVGQPSRGDVPFRLLVRDAEGQERVATADVVIDASGTYGQHNWMGNGGIPATGESAAAARIEYGLPDVMGRDHSDYVGRRVLVIGAGYSAATTVVALAELADSEPATKVVWVTRGATGKGGGGPVPGISGDRLPERDRLSEAANRLAGEQARNVVHHGATHVESVAWHEDGDRFTVRLSGTCAGEIEVDRIVANVGYRPDNRLFAELQVHECFASGGPMKLAAALLGESSADCLDQVGRGPGTLLNPEPNFYILGAKSYGRGSRFLLSIGYEQIRDVFSIIGDREDLDLYASMAHLVP